MCGDGRSGCPFWIADGSIRWIRNGSSNWRNTSALSERQGSCFSVKLTRFVQPNGAALVSGLDQRQDASHMRYVTCHGIDRATHIGNLNVIHRSRH